MGARQEPDLNNLVKYLQEQRTVITDNPDQEHVLYFSRTQIEAAREAFSRMVRNGEMRFALCCPRLILMMFIILQPRPQYAPSTLNLTLAVNSPEALSRACRVWRRCGCSYFCVGFRLHRLSELTGSEIFCTRYSRQVVVVGYVCLCMYFHKNALRTNNLSQMTTTDRKNWRGAVWTRVDLLRARTDDPHYPAPPSVWDGVNIYIYIYIVNRLLTCTSIA
jgi:hypothetical protein